MLVKINELKRTIKAKGKVVNVDEKGVYILDKKTEEIALLSLDLFKLFIGSEITFSIADSEKNEEEITETEETEDEDNTEDDE